MRITLILLSIILLSSCNPFISKDLRKKNKCNRKLERVVKKCPELLNTDTIIDTITVTIPEIRIDTVLKVEIDTLVIGDIINALDTIKTDKEKIRYLTQYVTQAMYIDTNLTIDGVFIHINLLDGELLVSIDKPLEVVKVLDTDIIQTIKKIKLTPLESFTNWIGKFWWILIFALAVLILYRWIKE